MSKNANGASGRTIAYRVLASVLAALMVFGTAATFIYSCVA